MDTVQEIIVAAVKLGLTPQLRNDGYKKTGTHFHNVGNGCTKVLNFQNHKHNTKTQGSFTVNLGVHFPALRQLVGRSPLASLPKEYQCDVRTRIGKLMSGKPDFWWSVSRDTNPEGLAADLRKAWESYARPWLERNSILPNTAVELEAQRLYFMAAAVHLLLGRKDEAARNVTQELKYYPRKAAQTKAWAQKNGVLPQ